MHQHTHHHGHNGSKNIAVAFFLNFSFTLIELAGGLFTNSVAILSDAVHDFGDSISLALAWYFEHISHHRPTRQFTYGYRRFTLLGALINALVLLIGSSLIIYECVQRFFEPQAVNAVGMLWLAVLGIVVNGAAVFYTRGKDSGINERVVSLHMLEDVLGWIAVLVVSIVMYFVDLPILDPLLSIAIAIFVLINVVRNMIETFHVMLEGVPVDVDLDALKTKLEQLPEIDNVHDLHVWSLDSQFNVASLHVVVASKDLYDFERIKALKQRIKALMRDEHIAHTTVEFEAIGEDCEKCS